MPFSSIFLNAACFSLTDKVRGLEKIWIIGDDFCERTFDEYYRHTALSTEPNRTFAFTNFEVRDFFSSEYTSHNRSPAGRIINKFILALNEHNTLPKLIVVVMDDNLFDNIKEHFAASVKKLLSWLMKEFDKAIHIYKDYLPIKAKSEFTPHFLWITPPTHIYFKNNHKREIVSDHLIKETKVYQYMSALRMVKVWEHDNPNLFNYHSCRFTAEGLATYWLSVESAIRYWNTAIYPKLGKLHNTSSLKRKHNDKFHWHKKQKHTHFNQLSRKIISLK